MSAEQFERFMMMLNALRLEIRAAAEHVSTNGYVGSEHRYDRVEVWRNQASKDADRALNRE